MPEYFSLILSIKKKDRYEHLFEDFVDRLQKTGFVFKSGYWGAEKETLEDIAAWNSKKLSADYELSYDEHYSKGYKQICWDYHGFSEVRLFIVNSKDEEAFSFEIIIPESEFVKFRKKRAIYDPQIIDDLKKLACELWQWNCISAIQTALELSDGDISVEEMENGKCPSAEPFAIIPESFLKESCLEGFEVMHIDRDGILIEEKNVAIKSESNKGS